MVLVYGVVHPPLEEVSDTRGWLFEADELETIRHLFYDKPVRLEHKPLLRAGSVLDLQLDEYGNLGAYLFVDETTRVGRVAMRRIRDGTALGLSVLFYAGQHPIHRGRVVDNTAIEISIVRYPLHRGSRILKYGNRFTQFISDSGIRKIVLNMSSPAQTNTDADPDVIDEALLREDQKLAAQELCREWEAQGICRTSIRQFIEAKAHHKESELKKLQEMEDIREQLFAEYIANDLYSKEILQQGINDHSTLVAMRIACSAIRDKNAMKTLFDLEKERMDAKALSTKPQISRPPLDAVQTSPHETAHHTLQTKIERLRAVGTKNTGSHTTLSERPEDLAEAVRRLSSTRMGGTKL